jgi:cation transport ATPase
MGSGKMDMGSNSHFFETSSTLITFVVMGKLLEVIAKGQTSQAHTYTHTHTHINTQTHTHTHTHIHIHTKHIHTHTHTHTHSHTHTGADASDVHGGRRGSCG